MDVTFRFLGPDEGTVLTGAIEAAYGQTYDVRWVYDPDEVNARIGAGTYVACVAETPAGELLCHIGMTLAAAGDAVAHSGQAVTLPAARGQHLFTRTKRHLMDWARERGLAGMYSEATAAHPYSQKANIELGAHETGFLLGWIPATVANDAAGGRRGRQSAALFYTKLNDGHERRVYAPERHRVIVAQTIELCELRGTLADHLERLGVSYAGVFPNSRTDGDVLRMQSLHRVRVKADDVAVASDHGRELLEYVLADLPQA
jgi:serine/threonine-protein kinase RsbW